MLTWNHLIIHNKKIFVLNSDGFYDHLIAYMKKLEEEKFLYESVVNKITIVNEPEDLRHAILI